MTSKYDDIIDHPHHISQKHPQMTMQERAAQFSPFAALTGHGVAIRETERLTSDWSELDEDELEALDRSFVWLRDHLTERPEIKVLYFEPDQKKEGGDYVSTSGIVRKIDMAVRILLLTDGKRIPLDHVRDIEILLWNIEKHQMTDM